MKLTPDKVQFVTVNDDDEGQRIDNYLMRIIHGVPRPLVYRVLRKGEVRVNKGRVKQSYRLVSGDVVRVPPIKFEPVDDKPLPPRSVIDELEQSIIYEGDGWLAINKPSGIAVHGGSGVRLGVIEAMRVLRPKLRYLELAHRLDRDTSGCLLMATKGSALRAVHEALRSRAASKDYLALVAGRWSRRKNRIDAPLLKTHRQSGERIVRVDEQQGKPAVTQFQLLSTSDEFSLVRAHPVTGRTHQIRVHAQVAGHPIAGDEKYSTKDINARAGELGLRRLFLHAERLSIKALALNIYAPLDSKLVDVVHRARLDASALEVGR